MASQIIEIHRAGVDVAKGGLSQSRSPLSFFRNLASPTAYSPWTTLRSSGEFMWIVHKKKKEHTFKKIKQAVSYATEVTAFAEKGKLKKVVGIKTKKSFLWLNLVDVYVEESCAEQITFKTGTELSDSFDASAFEIEM